MARSSLAHSSSRDARSRHVCFHALRFARKDYRTRSGRDVEISSATARPNRTRTRKKSQRCCNAGQICAENTTAPSDHNLPLATFRETRRKHLIKFRIATSTKKRRFVPSRRHGFKECSSSDSESFTSNCRPCFGLSFTKTSWWDKCRRSRSGGPQCSIRARSGSPSSGIERFTSVDRGRDEFSRGREISRARTASDSGTKIASLWTRRTKQPPYLNRSEISRKNKTSRRALHRNGDSDARFRHFLSHRRRRFRRDFRGRRRHLAATTPESLRRIHCGIGTRTPNLLARRPFGHRLPHRRRQDLAKASVTYIRRPGRSGSKKRFQRHSHGE